MEFEEEILKEFNNAGINLTDKQVNKFKKYFKLLITWNQKFNLTAIISQTDVIKKHFLDSVLGNCFLTNDNLKVIDIGAGAGFPSIPLKIIYDNLDITMIDSVNKKIGFLTEVIKELKLDDIKAIHFRAEDIANNNEYRESFDVCLSRAVAQLNTLAEYCLPFCKIEGKLIAYKSKNLEEELKTAKNALNILGGRVEEIKNFNIDDNQRNLILIKKVKKTPKEFPRGKNKPRLEPII